MLHFSLPSIKLPPDKRQLIDIMCAFCADENVTFELLNNDTRNHCLGRQQNILLGMIAPIDDRPRWGVCKSQNAFNTTKSTKREIKDRFEIKFAFAVISSVHPFIDDTNIDEDRARCSPKIN